MKKSQELDAETRYTRPPYWLIFKKVSKELLTTNLHKLDYCCQEVLQSVSLSVCLSQSGIL